MEKRLLAIAAVGLLAVNSCFYAFGQEDKKTVAVEKFDLELKVPGDWKCFTADMKADDPLFLEMDADGASFLKLWEQNGIYIDAISDNLEMTLVHVSASEDITQLASMSDKDLDKLMAEMGKQNQNQALDNLKKKNASLSPVDGLTLDPTEIYKKGPVTYMVSDMVMSSQDIKIYGQQYYTIVNGQVFTFNFNSLTGNLVTDAQKSAAREVIDTVVFGHIDAEKRTSWSLLRGIITGACVGAVVGTLYVIIRKMAINIKKKKKDSK